MSVCLITGCSGGLGLETALYFARKKETVVAGVHQLARAGHLERRCTTEGLDVDVVALDVDIEPCVAEAVAGVIERHGRIDVLINNAGIGLAGAIEESSESDVRRLFETNVFGPPCEVAAAVYEAASRPDHLRRRPVGRDAELVAGLRRELDDAALERTVRTALDFWD